MAACPCICPNCHVSHTQRFPEGHLWRGRVQTVKRAHLAAKGSPRSPPDRSLGVFCKLIKSSLENSSAFDTRWLPPKALSDSPFPWQPEAFHFHPTTRFSHHLCSLAVPPPLPQPCAAKQPPSLHSPVTSPVHLLSSPEETPLFPPCPWPGDVGLNQTTQAVRRRAHLTQ